ncbi:MAG: FHA domain-containing protein [Mycobacteriales bacterium]
MAYVQVGDRQYPLVPGENGIGSVEGTRVPVPVGVDGVEQIVAVIVVEADGGIVIRRVGCEVSVNGVHLGVEPTPLIHGDKIEIGSTELFFGDDRKGGSTQFVTAVKRPQAASAPAVNRSPAVVAGGAAGRVATGGRLVSLVDGREYVVPEDGLVLGRDPTCDVVVPTGEVSRKHAVITVGADGYVITDMSANGLSVNGDRVASSSRLVRGDVIKLGAEEFRFHADVTPARPVLATLEVKSTGVLQGQTFEIRSALTHIGRGAHNEVVLADESVSDSHAKLQHRDDGWYVVDTGSTNGTYVGGRRILGEAQLQGAPDLRVGGIKFIFRPTDTGGIVAQAGGGLDSLVAGSPGQAGAEGGAGQTRAIAALTPEERARLLAAARDGGAAGGGVGRGDGEPGVSQETEVGVVGGREPERRRRPSLLFWVVMIVLAAIAVFLFF